MDVAAQRVLAAGRQAAPMQAEQPRRGLFHPFTGIGRGEELRPQRLACRPFHQEQLMTGIVGEGLGNGETPGAEPTAPQFPQRLVDVRALIVAVDLGQEPPPLGGAPLVGPTRSASSALQRFPGKKCLMATRLSTR